MLLIFNYTELSGLHMLSFNILLTLGFTMLLVSAEPVKMGFHEKVFSSITNIREIASVIANNLGECFVFLIFFLSVIIVIYLVFLLFYFMFFISMFCMFISPFLYFWFYAVGKFLFKVSLLGLNPLFKFMMLNL